MRLLIVSGYQTTFLDTLLTSSCLQPTAKMNFFLFSTKKGAALHCHLLVHYTYFSKTPPHQIPPNISNERWQQEKKKKN